MLSSLDGEEPDNESAIVQNGDDPGMGDDPGEIIMERDGINLINNDIFSPDHKIEKNLDDNFKNLVDSVISPAAET
jgi:hypothetical protein